MLTNKYSRWYFAIINKAKFQNRTRTKPPYYEGPYFEAHHIIPKCLGGTETVLLTAREHFICHWLLIYMYDGPAKRQMQHALWKLTKGGNQKQHRNYSARQYELGRKHHAEAMRSKPLKHGVFNTYYSHGCRCNICTEWHQQHHPNKQGWPSRKGVKHTEETKQKLRIANIGKPGPRTGTGTTQHGTYALYNRGCRCEACCEARRVHHRLYYNSGTPRGPRGQYQKSA